MDFDVILDAVQGSALAEAVSKSNHLVGAGLQIVHILGFVLLLASLLLVSLRLLGRVLVDEPVERIAGDARRLSWLGLSLALASGILIFIATPRLYVGNAAFQLKLGLFVAASLFQITWFRRLAAGPARRRLVVRWSVAVTLVLWFGVGFAGRMIGFI
jgi:uncharacterized membrane protein